MRGENRPPEIFHLLNFEDIFGMETISLINCIESRLSLKFFYWGRRTRKRRRRGKYIIKRSNTIMKNIATILAIQMAIESPSSFPTLFNHFVYCVCVCVGVCVCIYVCVWVWMCTCVYMFVYCVFMCVIVSVLFVFLTTWPCRFFVNKSICN